MKFQEYLIEQKRLTLKTINKKLSELEYDIQLHKGKGYFYFWGDDVDPSSEGVYVSTLNQLTLNQWMEEALRRIESEENKEIRKEMRNKDILKL